MKKTKKRGLGRTICLGVLTIMMVVLFSTSTKSYAATKTITDVNLNIITAWTSGYLNEETGAEVVYKRRIFTTDYFLLDGKDYEVFFSNPDCILSVFYYDENYNYVSFEKLYDGYVIKGDGKIKYFRLNLRKVTLEKTMSSGQWGKLFAAGTVEINIKAIPSHESCEINLDEVIDTTSYELFDEINVTSSTGWLSGGIDKTTGEPVTNKRRLYTEDYYPIYDQTLSITFSQDGFNIQVYEYDEDYNFIRMTVATDDSDVEVAQETRYVRFCLYRVQLEKQLSPGQWGKLFAAGLSLSISADETETMNESSVVTAPVSSLVGIDAKYYGIYSEMKKMLSEGDGSSHDISKYGFSISEMNEVTNALRNGEGKYYYAACNALYLGNYNLDKKGICHTMQFVGMDSDFLNRYNRMMSSLNEIKLMVTSEMTDLDKVLLVHEYLVDKAYYEKTSTNRANAGGVLGDGHGLCSGYANAFNVAMDYLGIEAKYTSSDEMNHAWNIVKIDGQYYHVDCTWDNTIEEKNGYIGHNYLMASDSRFKKSIPTKHYNWATRVEGEINDVVISASSTKYDSWFVHDVKGKMVYANGYWYYSDGKIIKRSKVTGSDMSTVLTETGNVSIIGMSQGKLQYKVNGVVKTIAVK